MKIYLTYRERVAGFFLLVTLILISLFIVGAAIENLWFTPRVNFHIYVNRGEGLRQGSPVLLSGVEIGDVGDLTIMKDHRIDVQLSILEEHAYRITKSTSATVQRQLGIGEKRVLLTSPLDKPGSYEQLPAESVLPVEEPKDLLEIVSSVDLGRYMDTMDKAVQSADLLLTKLDEEDRMVRMIEAFDELGPTLKKIHELLEEINEPFAALIKDPAVPGTFRGASRVFNDRNTRKMIRNMSKTFEPEKINNLIEKTDSLIGTLDNMLAEDGPVQGSFEGADRLLNDGRIDRMLASMERLTNEEKIEKLLDNMTLLSSQMAKIGPEIPGMAREMVKTMRELSIVLKALQRTWLLDDETEDVLKELRRQKK